MPADVPVLRVPGTRAVEHPVAQDDSLDPASRKHRLLDVPDGLDGRAYGWGSVEVQRSVLRLHRSAGLRVPVGGALHNEAANPSAKSGAQQILRPLPTHTVVGGVVLPELARVQTMWKVGELVDHRVRFGPRYNSPQTPSIEDVAQDWLGANVAELGELRLRSRYRGHLVTCLEQTRN
jgi:hypothetical protein